MHVIEPEGARGSADASGGRARPRKENPKLVAQLHALVPKEARDRFDLEADVLESGDAAEAIAQEAERFRADAICLGSHGRSGLAKTLLGSVAQGVMTKTTRPVLIIRAEEQ
jgi:nucleotide-binding universal stress UspA family protein